MSENNRLNEPWHVEDVNLPICNADGTTRLQRHLIIRGADNLSIAVMMDYGDEALEQAIIMALSPLMKNVLERLADFANLTMDDLVDDAKTILKEIENETKEA